MMPRMRPHPTTLSERAAAGPEAEFLPERLNIAERFLDARVREGRGERVALRTDAGTLTYRDVQALAERWAHVLAGAGVCCEQRVLIAHPDTPDFVGALFGTLKLGAVVVMVNPGLPPAEARYFLEYTRARAVVTVAASAARSLLMMGQKSGLETSKTLAKDADFTTRLIAIDALGWANDASAASLLKTLLTESPANSQMAVQESLRRHEQFKKKP